VEKSLQARIGCRHIVELQAFDNCKNYVRRLRRGAGPVSSTASSGSLSAVCCSSTGVWGYVARARASNCGCAYACHIGPPSTCLLR